MMRKLDGMGAEDLSHGLDWFWTGLGRDLDHDGNKTHRGCQSISRLNSASDMVADV